VYRIDVLKQHNTSQHNTVCCSVLQHIGMARVICAYISEFFAHHTILQHVTSMLQYVRTVRVLSLCTFLISSLITPAGTNILHRISQHTSQHSIAHHSMIQYNTTCNSMLQYVCTFLKSSLITPAVTMILLKTSAARNLCVVLCDALQLSLSCLSLS
jgi:hypothetical protein